MSTTLDLVRDYLHFITTFFEVIHISAPHIYHSALPLSPQTSIVHKLYKQYACPFARVVRGLPILWEPSTVTEITTTISITWSPCSSFIAVARSGSVDILDPATLYQLSTIEHPLSYPNHLSISPDGCLLMMFASEDMAVLDLQTGGPVATILTEKDIKPRWDHCFSTISMDGKAVAIAYEGCKHVGYPSIITYDLISETHTPHHILEGHIIISIWTQGEYLQFATVTKGYITIWEATFTLTYPPTEVECLPAPDEIVDGREFLFLPTLFRVAFILSNEILVWDAKASKLLLRSKLSLELGGNSFSSDGHFLSCVSFGQVYVWKESSAGYVLHQIFRPNYSSLSSTASLLSPDGRSVIFHPGDVMHLWSTNDQILPQPSYPKNPDIHCFILEISRNKMLAAFAHQDENTATVFDLYSGSVQLVIDVDMYIECLRVTETTVVITDLKKIVTWNIPSGNSTLNARVNTSNSIQTTRLDILQPIDQNKSTYASISPGLNFIALLGESFSGEQELSLYDVFTGRCLFTASFFLSSSILQPRFTLDEHEVWAVDDFHFDIRRGWKIIGSSDSGITGLEPLALTVNPPPEILPGHSSHGYHVIGSGWVLSATQEHLLWLPHLWRSHKVERVWDGHILCLLTTQLTEPVVLEFFE